MAHKFDFLDVFYNDKNSENLCLQSDYFNARVSYVYFKLRIDIILLNHFWLYYCFLLTILVFN